jgi:hypothetical protein
MVLRLYACLQHEANLTRTLLVEFLREKETVPVPSPMLYTSATKELLMRVVVPVLLIALLTSCNPLSSPDMGQAGIPADAPSICGVITSLSPDALLVEEDPEAESGSAKAMMRVQKSTRVLHRDGSTTHYSALAVGQTVSAWFDGPVAESYPVQTAAGVIVLEASQGCG